MASDEVAKRFERKFGPRSRRLLQNLVKNNVIDQATADELAHPETHEDIERLTKYLLYAAEQLEEV